MTFNVCMRQAIHLHLYLGTNTNASKFYTQTKLQENKSIFVDCDCYILTLFRAILYPLFFLQSPSVVLRHLIALRVEDRRMQLRNWRSWCSVSYNVAGQLRPLNQNFIKYELFYCFYKLSKIFLLKSISFNLSLHFLHSLTTLSLML